MTAPVQSTVWYPGPSGAPAQVAALAPKDDPFYWYASGTPLESIAPGAVNTLGALAPGNRLEPIPEPSPARDPIVAGLNGRPTA
ncbi:hypothetical protein [Mycobacterium sp.]|uniref:hypothetical protein n=1 Tax=Mycobacterium sp. TaxID=1785 RepID=UPI003F992EF1